MLVPFLTSLVMQTGGEIVLTQSMDAIRSSVRIKHGDYTLADLKGSGALRVDADNVTIDFQGSTIESPVAKTGRLETFNGIGLSISDHKHVTIRNVKIHGFQFNIKALRCGNLTLENCELGQSRSQKIVDHGTWNAIWLDLRGLESWRSYGAAAWLEECTVPFVKGVRANQSQNGLIMVKSKYGTVVGCDFSYNSGWGIALCRSSDNLICWNHADFVNRPWAGGWGGDSSGVTETTQCNRNIWAFNSFTHSGDGFFLATLNGGFDDKGVLHEEGPCAGNWVVRNDGSWSTANAFEATFSTKNIFYRNTANDSNYGFWLGYSNGNIVAGNEIIRSHQDGIANEQGSRCVYVGNTIEDTAGSAIHLWSGLEERFKVSPSDGNLIARNRIVNAKAGLTLQNSTHAILEDNDFLNAPISKDLKQGKGMGINELEVPRKQEIMNLKPKGFRMYRATDLPRGWQWLAPTAYGMKDYRKVLAPWTMQDARTIRLFVRPNLVKKVDIPTWMEVSIKGNEPNEWLVTSKNNDDPIGKYRPFRFRVIGKSGKEEWVEGQLLDLKWHVRWFSWFRNDHDAFSDSEGWKTLFDGPAIKEEVRGDLPEIVGYRAPEPGLPKDHYAMVADTKLKLGSGTYRFDTLSDDGIQVLVDGNLVINNWTHHGGTQDTGSLKLASGVHSIEVRYCQEDGGAALSVHWSQIGSK